jgi:hypothetical protein
MSNQPSLLEYRSLPPRVVPSIWLYRIALACGALPMGTGTIFFLLLLISRHLDFAVGGLFTIFAGCCAVFVGFVCLGVYYFQSRRAAADERKRAAKNILLAIVLLLVNFPVAFFMALIGMQMAKF